MRSLIGFFSAILMGCSIILISLSVLIFCGEEGDAFSITPGRIQIKILGNKNIDIFKKLKEFI